MRMLLRVPAMAAHRLHALAARFGASTRGVAAVEFAMILPVMVVMYLGMTELTFGVNTDRKLTSLSRALADLTGRSKILTEAQMDEIFAAALSVMAPYKSDGAKMVISSVYVKEKKTGGNTTYEGKVCWSRAKGTGATALKKDDPVPVPEGFRTNNTTFILAEVTMDYKPIFGSGILKLVSNNGLSTITLNERTPWPVRNVPEVQVGTAPLCLT